MISFLLARSMESAFVLLALIFGFVLVMNVMQTRAKEKRERFRILEAAIRSGNLDLDTKQELVQGLTGRRLHHPSRDGWRLRLMFGLGWLGLFLGIALMSIGGRDELQAGIVISAMSFGVITLPFAMRELEGRRSNRDARSEIR